MRISVSWLRALVPGLDADARSIAALLTRGGFEVEAVIPFGAGLENVVVAQVQSVRPHPKKSTLRLVTVDRGGASQEVVCGAPNVPEPGGLVVLAPVGAKLGGAVGAITIEPKAIAGVMSEGMLCSEEELGIAFSTPRASSAEAADRGSSILVLPDGTAKPGTPLKTAIPAVSDDILEIAVTPNRPDALGHIGVAREVAALLQLPFGVPEPTAPNRFVPLKIDALVRVRVEPEAVDRCPHYGALAVVDVKTEPSPPWVRYRLHSLGVRSISNVVDVSNLVMLEYGHPLHAFDLDRLEGSQIQVRLAREGEQIVTLDSVTRTLTSDDLVICDGAPNGGKPVALAGVMGAGNSEISASSTRVLIECAYFDPRGIRRTARRHGLHSESSHRFERGVDPGDVADVLSQAAALTVRLAHGAAVTGMINAIGKEWIPKVIALRHDRIGALLGDEVEREEVAGILDRLGCEVGPWVEGRAEVTVPTHRPDLDREVDLIEEVARVRGFDRIAPARPSIAPQPARSTGALERKVRHVACALGLSEAVSYAFENPRNLAALGAPEPSVTLANPLGEERSVMRTSLLLGLFSALVRSRRRGERSVRLFEVGKIFLPAAATTEPGLCNEVSSFAAVVAGPRDAWLGRGEDADVYDAKGIAVELVRRATGHDPVVSSILSGRPGVSGSDDACPVYLHPRGAASVSVSGTRVGVFGPLHPDTVDRFELDGPTMVVELDLRKLASLPKSIARFQALPSLPATSRDVALEVDEPVTAGSISDVLREAAGPLCQSIEVFDVYRGKGIAPGKKSIAFRLTYRDPAMARTLSDTEVDAAQARAIDAARAAGAILRG